MLGGSDSDGLNFGLLSSFETTYVFFLEPSTNRFYISSPFSSSDLLRLVFFVLCMNEPSLLDAKMREG